MSSPKPDTLARLHDLAVFLGADADLNEHLEDLARHAAEATQAAACSIALLSEEEIGPPHLKLYASTDLSPIVGAEQTVSASEGLIGLVLKQGKSLLIPDISKSKFAALARKRSDMGSSFIGVSIIVAEYPIGVMNLSNAVGAPPFGDTDLTVAEIVAAMIGKAIQVDRVQTLLRSRIAQQHLINERTEVTQRLTAGTMPPSRLAKLLARSFYKDLASAGFESGQIIEAASEIITQITSDIGRFEKRLAKKHK